MPPQLRLHSGQLADLAEYRDTPLDVLKKIVVRLAEVAPRPIRPKELLDHISQALGGKPEAANRILRTLLSLQAIIRQRRVKTEEVVEAVRQGLDAADPKWTDDEFDRWRSVEQTLGQLLDTDAIRLVSTTLDLMYEYQNLLQIARVVTDIRPVFSKDATAIEGSVVSHTLRIHYDSTEGDHSISLAVDEGDILELKRQCERALKKAQTARNLMTELAKVPTVIAGDGSNAET